jgi:hypothetical protein
MIVNLERVQERLKSIVATMNRGHDVSGFLAQLQKDIDEALHTPSHKHSYWHLTKPVIAVDFDGVIHSYKRPWIDAWTIPDDPLPGAFTWLANLTLKFSVMIYSARCNDEKGIAAMKEWFVKHGMSREFLDAFIFEPGKPSAFLFIDDRAMNFNGSYGHLSVAELRRFRPWYYDHEEWKR